MQLDMKTRCEKCGNSLLPHEKAFICSYECTFCPTCALNSESVCPHCGGELVLRPRRIISRTDAAEVKAVASRPWLIWTVSFGAWTLVALAGSATISQLYRSIGRPADFLGTLGMEMSQILPYAPLTPLVLTLATLYPVRRKNWARRSALYLACGLAFAVLHVGMRGLTPYALWDAKTHAWYSAIRDPQTHLFKIQWRVFENLFLANVVDDVTGAYVPIVLIAHVVSFYRKTMERERRASRLEAQLAKANLQALKSQLQPHFLFNTMHSISALMHTDVLAADKMMSRLSDLLRMSLESDGEQITSLNRELEFVNGYLEIEQIRFGERLKVVLDISPDTLDAQTPRLLLQPLVENAVRHGIARLTAGGEILIRSRHDGANLQLTVRDNGPGFDKEDPRAGGLGLRATQERLLTLYGKDQRFSVLARPEGGVEVFVQIPFHQMSED
jgi:two-component system LytT family sensor kinase